MRITCVGGGPAGLYFAICAMRRDAGHEITVLDRDPRGATYGWGVGYWDDLLDTLFAYDRASALRVRAASTVWTGREVVLPGQRSAHLGGYGYTINRSALLEILTERAEELGVEIRHDVSVDSPAELDGADLVVGTDGVNSWVRSQYAHEFGPDTRLGQNRYIWLGTEQRFTRMTFAFEQTDAGWIWFYGYPSGPGISTCVVECTPEAWRGLGLDTADSDTGLQLLEEIFRGPLAGHSLISHDRGMPARWAQYRSVSNTRWTHDNVVLLGDAAHTVHFTMGSGTGLAMMDAAELATSLYQRSDLAKGLARYERKRQSAVRRAQSAGRTSMAWFEEPSRHLGRNAVDVAFALATRYQPERPWQRLVHQTTQLPPALVGRRAYDTGQRLYLARRRGEPLRPV